MWNSSTSDFECHNSCQIGDYLGIKNCAFKKFVIDISVLICEDEILTKIKTTAEIVVERKQSRKKIIVLFIRFLGNCIFTFVSCHFF